MCCRSWDGQFVVDKRMSFGGYFAPSAFTEFRDALMWVWEREACATPALDFLVDDIGESSREDILALLRAADDELRPHARL